MLAKDYGIPPAAVNDLTLSDFAILTDAADEQIRTRQTADGR